MQTINMKECVMNLCVEVLLFRNMCDLDRNFRNKRFPGRK